LRYVTAGRVAAFGLILFIIGNELSEPALRQVLEILAGVLASASFRTHNGHSALAAGTTLHAS